MKKEKGITLIALVITIIVLLILAGISITTLTGENGLLRKANRANIETVKKSAEEKVKIAVAGSFGTNGELHLNDLNTNLRQVEGLTDILYKDSSIFNENKIEKLPIDVVVDGYIIEIDENGKVTLKAIKPVVNYTLSTEEQVAEGTKITVTITAKINGGESITKIIYGETTVTNKETMTFEVTKNGYYKVRVEASNGETAECIVKVMNIGNTEIFSDIYTETKPFTDGSGKAVKIPEGFAVGISNTINKIENGLVITDQIDEFHRSIGNEFVWVPVTSSTFVRCNSWLGGNKQKIENYYLEPRRGADALPSEEADYQKMKGKVLDNNGFYIGRYETGKENNQMVIKKNKQVYHNAKWGTSMSDGSGGAVELATNFVDVTYTNKKKTVGVTSNLCYGVQWDSALQFIDNRYISENYNESSVLRTGTGKGWYENNVSGNPSHLTGVDVDTLSSNKLKNIYDMAGNFQEWTMEAYYVSTGWKNRVLRGGDYTMKGNLTSASSRSFKRPASTEKTWAFRICLCLLSPDSFY